MAFGREREAVGSSGFHEPIAQNDVIKARRPRRRGRIGTRNQILRFVFVLRTPRKFLHRVLEQIASTRFCERLPFHLDYGFPALGFLWPTPFSIPDFLCDPWRL
jgi:hypothetical protein